MLRQVEVKTTEAVQEAKISLNRVHINIHTLREIGTNKTKARSPRAKEMPAHHHTKGNLNTGKDKGVNTLGRED